MGLYPQTGDGVQDGAGVQVGAFTEHVILFSCTRTLAATDSACRPRYCRRYIIPMGFVLVRTTMTVYISRRANDEDELALNDRWRFGCPISGVGSDVRLLEETDVHPRKQSDVPEYVVPRGPLPRLLCSVAGVFSTRIFETHLKKRFG